jgi:hypothetical protein
LFDQEGSRALIKNFAAGANALDTARAIAVKMKEMSRYFPPGMRVVYPYDTTPFVKVAIEEVVKTLLEAILLEMEQYRGRQFDPRILEVFLQGKIYESLGNFPSFASLT